MLSNPYSELFILFTVLIVGFKFFSKSPNLIGMDISYIKYKNHADIAINGFLLVNPEAASYLEEIRSHIAHCNSNVMPITVNLGGVELISSVGLMAIVKSKEMMNVGKNCLVPYNLSECVYNLTVMGKLGIIFGDYKTKEDALNGLGLESKLCIESL